MSTERTVGGVPRRPVAAARRTAAGLTLVELAIVLLLVAILASLAVPGYRDHVLRSHRTAARAALLNLAAAQEEFYLSHGTYATDAQLSVAPPLGLGLSAAAGNGRYAIAIAAGADASGFSATATATGMQAADGDCAGFSIDHRGSKQAIGRDGAAAPACWR